MIENNEFDRIEELVKEAVEIVKGKPDVTTSFPQPLGTDR